MKQQNENKQKPGEVRPFDALVMPRIEVTIMFNNGKPTEFSEEIMITDIYGLGEVYFNEVKECAIEMAREEASEIEIPKNAFSATFACSNFVEDEVDMGLAKSRYMMCERVDLLAYTIQKEQEEPKTVSVV